MVHWYQGKLIESDLVALSINDVGLLYGATAFTTMKVYEQSLDHPLTNWIAHCDRLQRSIATFGWQLPNWESINNGVLSLIPLFPILRITLFPDGRELIIGRNFPEDLLQRQQQGIIGWTANNQLFQRSLGDYKTGNYLGAWLALQQANKLGAKEAILVDNYGNWLETSTGNLWGYAQGCWFTPSLQGILPGIVRGHLLKYLSVVENIWDNQFIRELEAIAYTNCVVEVIPFHTIIHPEGNLNPNAFHPALKDLRSCFIGSN